MCTLWKGNLEKIQRMLLDKICRKHLKIYFKFKNNLTRIYTEHTED